MTRVVEYELEPGKQVYVEVDDPTPEGLRKAARAETSKAERSLDEALESVMPVAERVLARAQKLAAAPSGIELELGIKFNAKAGAVLASTALEGNIRLKLTWAPSPAT